MQKEIDLQAITQTAFRPSSAAIERLEALIVGMQKVVDVHNATELEELLDNGDINADKLDSMLDMLNHLVNF